jgi:hypothetical protein
MMEWIAEPSQFLRLLFLSLQLGFCSAEAVPFLTPSVQSSESSEIMFHSSSDLALVDVISLNAKNGLPDTTLTRNDFQLFDDDHAVSIKKLLVLNPRK